MSLRFIASRWLRKGLLRSPHACLMGRANSGWRRPFPYPTTPGNDIFEEIPDRTSKLIECGLFDRKVRAVGQLAELLRAGHFLKHRHTHCGRSPAFSPGVHRKEWEFVIETQRPVAVKRTEEPGPHPFFTYQGVASEIGLHVRVTAQCQTWAFGVDCPDLLLLVKYRHRKPPTLRYSEECCCQPRAKDVIPYCRPQRALPGNLQPWVQTSGPDAVSTRTERRAS
jgi:hypothetical protein